MCPGVPFMALTGIHNDDECSLVGTAFDGTFADAGDPVLEINDWVFTDNAGRFTIPALAR